MRIDSPYTLAARDDIASAIDHFLLRRLPEHARKAVLDLSRGVDFLLREKVSLMSDRANVDEMKFPELLSALRKGNVRVPGDSLWTLRGMRNDAEHAATYPDPAVLERVAKSLFPFIWDFIHSQLGFAAGEGFDSFHTAILKGQPLSLCGRAKLLSAAALKHVHEEPHYAVEFADMAVDSVIRDLADSCGIDQAHRLFPELIELLMEANRECEDWGPWYVLGENQYSEFCTVTPDFLNHDYGKLDAQAAESYVILARHIVGEIVSHTPRPRMEAAIRERWDYIRDALARGSPDSYEVAPRSLSRQSRFSVFGDTISIPPTDVTYIGDQSAAEDFERAIREAMPDLPAEFRVRLVGPGGVLRISGPS
jgi:hypothetical protein